jgi:hypothetical protein
MSVPSGDSQGHRIDSLFVLVTGHILDNLPVSMNLEFHFAYSVARETVSESNVPCLQHTGDDRAVLIGIVSSGLLLSRSQSGCRPPFSCATSELCEISRQSLSSVVRSCLRWVRILHGFRQMSFNVFFRDGSTRSGLSQNHDPRHFSRLAAKPIRPARR